MATPPTRLQLFPVGSLTPANAKTYFGQLYDYIYALLGADGSAAAARNALEVPMFNHLHNPDGEIYQRAVAATADDAYMDDRWYALTQTGTITPSQQSNPENGYHRGLRLTQSQASAQRMGRAQIVEASQTSTLRGKTVTFGGRFKLSTSATLRYAILAWTGTADAVTSDVVNDWTSGTYTTGNFFNSTTLSLVATGSTALTAATAATCSISGAVPAGATNIIVLYWTEATAAQNVTLDAWGLRLVDATTLVGAIQRSAAEELRLCRRFLPALVSSGITDYLPGSGVVLNSTTVAFNVSHEVQPRVPPTGFTPSAPGDFTINSVAGGGASSATVFVSGGAGKYTTRLSLTSSGMTAGHGCSVYMNSASAYGLFTGCDL